jgi:hypothetical protein
MSWFGSSSATPGQAQGWPTPRSRAACRDRQKAGVENLAYGGCRSILKAICCFWAIRVSRSNPGSCESRCTAILRQEARQAEVNIKSSHVHVDFQWEFHGDRPTAHRGRVSLDCRASASQCLVTLITLLAVSSVTSSSTNEGQMCCLFWTEIVRGLRFLWMISYWSIRA